MTRYIALCVAPIALGVVLGAAGPGHAQQDPSATQAQPSPAPTQEQVEQPAPDVENLKEEDLNRTQAVQQQQDQLQEGQQQEEAMTQPQLAEERNQANELLVTWQERLAEKPDVVEQSEPVQNAWADLREAHSAVVRADEASMPVAQQTFEESAERMEKVWTEATD